MMDFGEKEMEYSAKHGEHIPVWQSPKYKESKEKAIEIINSKKYNVEESDFWILMNVTKNNRMAYTGLVISHNGCLKINDCLASKFDPSCVTLDKDGYRGSLVYSYCNQAQGIYEVGEVNTNNCKNEYPYAMAFKRLFDRVVLKLSKLAYAGIYSDSEADEFAQRLDGKEPAREQKNRGMNGKTHGDAPTYYCEECTLAINTVKKRSGEDWVPADISTYSKKRFGRQLCFDCQKKAIAAEKAAGGVSG